MSAKTNKIRCAAWTEQQVAKADRFVACLFLGVGRYDKRESPTLEGARQHKEEMNTVYGTSNFGRKVAIYAITSGVEMSIFVE